MSGSRTTRKVTIDSGRRISSSGDFVEQSSAKSKSVFDRLGVITPKSVVKTKGGKAPKYSSHAEDGYNSEDNGGNDTKKSFVSFTVKKNSLMEESQNKLHMKKEKKKAAHDDDTVKIKKKKKQKDDTQPIAIYSKPKQVTNDDEEDDEVAEKHVQKKKKKVTSPDVQPTKKKRRVFEEDEVEEEAYVRKSGGKGRRKSLVEYQSGSENEEKEKKKKKVKLIKDSTNLIKRSKKTDGNNENMPKKKKKLKVKSSEDEISEEERLPKNKYKKQRSPSWSYSEDDEDEHVFKSKKKTKTADGKIKQKKQQRRASSSVSPVRESYVKSYSSFESDISYESEEDRKKKKKKEKTRVDFQDVEDFKMYEEKQRHFDQRQQGFDERRREEFMHNRKVRSDDYNREDSFNDRPDDRRRMNQFGQRGIDYDQGDWRQSPYGDRNRKIDQRFDDRVGNRGRMNNRFENRDNRDQEYFRDNRRDDRRPTDFRSGIDTNWNRQSMVDGDRYDNRMNFRGRGRGRGGRGSFRGGFHQQNMKDERYQHRDYDYRFRNNPMDDRSMDQQHLDRYQKHGGFRDHKDFRRGDQRMEKQFELSPIRDPNFIGGIAKKRDLSDSDEEDERPKKRKHVEKSKKRNSKDGGSASDVSDTEIKASKKQKAKSLKSSENISDKEEKEKSKPSKIEEIETVKSPKKSSKVKDRGTSSDRKKQENDSTTEDKKSSTTEKKKDKKVSHKRVAVVKSMEDPSPSSGKKTPDTLKDSDKQTENIGKKSEKKEERKRDLSVGSSKDIKRDRTEKNRNTDDRDKTSESRRRSPDSRRGRSSRTPDRRVNSPDVRNSPYKRGRSPERRERNRDSSFSGKDLNDRSNRNRGNTPSSTKDSKVTDSVSKNEDVYESISDEELELFDENEEDYKLPQPASVMDVDWSLLLNMNKPLTARNDTEEKNVIPGYMQKLLPGHVLSDIGYSPSLLSKKTLERVQALCLSAQNIDADTLDVAEETQLRTGMAVTVKNVLKQRHARDALFSKDLIGLRNDLALRRELRKPLDKIGTNYNVFCSAPANPVDYELFASAVSLFEKKPQTDTDPLYISILSKVGSIVACKS